MQLIDIATNSIALFGFAYFIAALAAHLHFCWSNLHTIELKRFDRKLAATVEAIAPAELEPMPVLLPPATEVHPFELSLERMLIVEPIAALHHPAAEVELLTEESIELPHVEEAIDLTSLSSTALRAICTQRGIRWRGVKNGKHLSKTEMLAALTA